MCVCIRMCVGCRFCCLLVSNEETGGGGGGNCVNFKQMEKKYLQLHVCESGSIDTTPNLFRRS